LTKDDSVANALGILRQRHGNHLASVIHLAAYYDFSGEPSPLYRDLTIEGTRRLLRGLQSFEVEQFVFASTLLVMKPSEDDEPIHETWPTEPAWEYPKSKLATERVIEHERGKMLGVILRIAGVYDENCNSVPISQQISRIMKRSWRAICSRATPAKARRSFILTTSPIAFTAQSNDAANLGTSRCS
jgi:nucleoside-diphosphate-sugar epimerase